AERRVPDKLPAADSAAGRERGARSVGNGSLHRLFPLPARAIRRRHGPGRVEAALDGEARRSARLAGHHVPPSGAELLLLQLLPRAILLLVPAAGLVRRRCRGGPPAWVVTCAARDRDTC